ncbi:DUF350 domain-containing protein [Nocardia farcinica]|uniref:DUF350 domain-containing protein n=1 Tax=Nocardia farcinica TaxID=37329 RepID=UPI001895FC5A|nr:DUF350 domain-containing protein [Nocardia farcinica]MBF6417670.1 DUF350 domain-containing protein [Nocardia farcinica]MBF6428826.1 DUF350 domain-containing protein [Nocardia farcinica]MBF6502030.1 DUF350 domain-containing protein [Nocardia farcinica]
MLADLAAEAGAALAYTGVGLVLMVLGFVLVDALTPGNLRAQIWVERNRNAAVLVASNLFGVGVIVAMAIWTSHGALGEGLLACAVYGVIGLAAMAVSFVLLDLLTPGKFREVVAEQALHPAVWVTAPLHVAVSLVVAAGLS